VTPTLLDIVPEVTGRKRRASPRPAVELPSPEPERAPAQSRVLAEWLFKDALVRERKRADRFEQPFAVLVAGWGDRSADDGRWVAIERAAAAVTREIDIVGWLEEDAVMGLLLPQASGQGALKVMHRLRHEIARQLGDVAAAAMSIRAYEHGSPDGVESAALPPVALLVSSIVERRGRPWRDAAKRGLDIFGSAALLALFTPLALTISAAVKLTSPGPVHFKQVRIGKWGRPFTMLKFRTMHMNAGHGIHQDYVSWFIKSSGQQPRAGNEVFKLTNDPRITRVGRFLRRTSFDELPQFWNVLWGDMSLVGPRPPLPFEVEQYQAWHRRRVLEAKPGVTGPWQVNGRSRTTFDEMVRIDLRYARAHSLWTDIKLLAATPRAMLSGKGAA